MHLYSTRSATLPPARARLALSPSLSALCGMRYCQPALPTVQRASTESIPRCHRHLQVDLNQISGPLVLRLVSVLSALLVSARLLPVDDPVVRRNLRDTPLVQPQEHHLLHLEGAHARPLVADDQSESRKVSLSLAACSVPSLSTVLVCLAPLAQKCFVDQPCTHTSHPLTSTILLCIPQSGFVAKI